MKLEHMWVGFDGDDLSGELYRAFVPAKRWNGFACPLMDEENLRKFLENQKKLVGDFDVVTGWIEGDVLHTRCGQAGGGGEQEKGMVNAQVIEHGGKSIKVWNVDFGLAWIDFHHVLEKGAIVKLAKPEEDEEGLRFIVLDYFEPRGGLAARVQVQFVCDDMPIKPVSTISADEVIPV